MDQNSPLTRSRPVLRFQVPTVTARKWSNTPFDSNWVDFFYFQSDNFPKSSEEIIAEWKINPIEMNYTEDEYRTLTTYRLVCIHLLCFLTFTCIFRIFASSMRPRITAVNPSLRQGRMQTLMCKFPRAFDRGFKP